MGSEQKPAEAGAPESRQQNMRSTLAEAQSIVRAAEQRAQEILRAAEGSFEESKEKGYREGYQKGQRDVCAHAVRMIEETSTLQQHLSREAARLAIAIAGSVIGQQIAVSPEIVTQIAAKALQESAIGDSVRIIVNPADEPTMQKAKSTFTRLAEGASIAIEIDESISRGGCLVRTEFGEIDATVETLLAMINKRLGLETDE